MVTVLDDAGWNLLGGGGFLINRLNWGCNLPNNALLGQGRAEGTAVVPQKEKTLCTREWALLSGMTNYKFREVWRALFSLALAINSESCWAKTAICVECQEQGKEGGMGLNVCMVSIILFLFTRNFSCIELLVKC